MSDDKMPMQADGGATRGTTGADAGTNGAGESGGGAYPNQHTGKKAKNGFLSHGGQTEITEKSSGGEVKEAEYKQPD